jgi:hypothetical protein
MMKMRAGLNEEEIPGQMPQAQPQTPQAQPQAKPPSDGNQAFSSLQGQTIAGVSFSANGDAGGVIKIMLKNSYNPFQISWVNQNVTVTDAKGNVINIGDSR